MMKRNEMKENDLLLSDQMFYTYREAAKILRCSERTLYNRVRNGDILPLRNGRLVLFTMECLDDFLRKNQISNKPMELGNPELN